MPKLFLVCGATLAALAVALGAVGSHALAAAASEKHISWFATAVRYHQFSALGMLAIGMLSLAGFNSRWTTVGGSAVLAGALVFCGSLYVMALGGPRFLGALTPIGGTLMITGWASLAVGLYVARPDNLRPGKSC